jgi:hypothetical protein
MNDNEKRARELLAAEFERYGDAIGAAAARFDRPADGVTLRAIIAALTPPDGFVLVPVDIQKDAARYRWLRDSAPEEWDATRRMDSEDYLDEAIDEAMLAARPEVSP